MAKVFKCPKLSDTRALGEQIGALLNKGDVVALNGELGAGKTTLTQAIAKGMGIDDVVTSATFSLINEYDGDVPLYHFDTYRLDNVEAMAYMGFDEYFYGDGVCVVEWAETIRDFLPEAYLDIEIDGDHTFTIKGSGHYGDLVERLC
uniref:tRNA (adenosine(37)-N6)-threonylcarbamoyltransferase complex ATPase subunit type 1 TsaE n=1 Tax=Peptoniphilus equinus TaxID=3016343 RepID=UPI0036F22221